MCVCVCTCTRWLLQIGHNDNNVPVIEYRSLFVVYTDVLFGKLETDGTVFRASAVWQPVGWGCVCVWHAPRPRRAGTNLVDERVSYFCPSSSGFPVRTRRLRNTNGGGTTKRANHPNWLARGRRIKDAVAAIRSANRRTRLAVTEEWSAKQRRVYSRPSGVRESNGERIRRRSDRIIRCVRTVGPKNRRETKIYCPSNIELSNENGKRVMDDVRRAYKHLNERG